MGAVASWVYVGENFGWFVENGQGGDIGQVPKGCSARALIKNVSLLENPTLQNPIRRRAKFPLA